MDKVKILRIILCVIMIVVGLISIVFDNDIMRLILRLSFSLITFIQYKTYKKENNSTARLFLIMSVIFLLGATFSLISIFI